MYGRGVGSCRNLCCSNVTARIAAPRLLNPCCFALWSSDLFWTHRRICEQCTWICHWIPFWRVCGLHARNADLIGKVLLKGSPSNGPTSPGRVLSILFKVNLDLTYPMPRIQVHGRVKSARLRIEKINSWDDRINADGRQIFRNHVHNSVVWQGNWARPILAVSSRWGP